MLNGTLPRADQMSESIRKVLRKALHSNRKDRFSSLHEFATAFVAASLAVDLNHNSCGPSLQASESVLNVRASQSDIESTKSADETTANPAAYARSVKSIAKTQSQTPPLHVVTTTVASLGSGRLRGMGLFLVEAIDVALRLIGICICLILGWGGFLLAGSMGLIPFWEDRATLGTSVYITAFLFMLKTLSFVEHVFPDVFTGSEPISIPDSSGCSAECRYLILYPSRDNFFKWLMLSCPRVLVQILTVLVIQSALITAYLWPLLNSPAPDPFKVNVSLVGFAFRIVIALAISAGTYLIGMQAARKLQ